MDICITGMKRWKGMSGPEWRNKMWSLFNDGFEKLVRYRHTCVGGEWSWLCGKVYTGDKRAHMMTYFHVSLLHIKTKVIKMEALLFIYPTYYIFENIDLSCKQHNIWTSGD
jgi:hypothetical protein